MFAKGKTNKKKQTNAGVSKREQKPKCEHAKHWTADCTQQTVCCNQYSRELVAKCRENYSEHPVEEHHTFKVISLVSKKENKKLKVI